MDVSIRGIGSVSADDDDTKAPESGGYPQEIKDRIESKDFYRLYPVGTTITLTALPDSDRRLARWVAPSLSFDGSSDSSVTFEITSDVQVQAEFEFGQSGKQLLTIGFTGIGAVKYSPAGSSPFTEESYAVNPEYRSFDENEIVTLEAYPAEGWYFDGWWYPEDKNLPAEPADKLISVELKVVMDRKRFVWPVFLKKTTDLDLADPDEDGLANFREEELSTDPNRVDTDGDGLPDGWEANFGLDPLDEKASNGKQGDPDHDGTSNWVEYQNSTHPNRDESL